MNDGNSGRVLKIHRMARHDGPGIRTLVCMQGCPLRCAWCSTPESQARRPQLMVFEECCNGCDRCIPACPHGAIGHAAVVERSLCDGCGACAQACLYGALQLPGQVMEVDQLFAEIVKDSQAYRHSGGGVTIGGGELTLQSRFVAKVLARCRKVFIHTAIETCGFTPWRNLERLLPQVQLLYFDLKHMDDAEHRKITGASNRVILANAARAAQYGPMIIRIPVVPGLNDSAANIQATARFAAGLGANIRRLELLPYHNLGASSFQRLGRDYPLDGVLPQTEERMAELKALVEACGMPAQIGG